MDDGTALLAAIAAHPAEDTPRLTYADWLDEHADDQRDPVTAHVRAEFIRVQCELRRLESLSSEEQRLHIPLYRRQQDILDHHRRDLLGPLGVELGYFDAIFDRGFVAELKLDAARFLQHADTIAALRPLPDVSISDAAWYLMDLVASPHNQVVTAFRAQSDHRPYPTEIPGAELERFICSRDFGRLRSLDLESTRCEDFGLILLCKCDTFKVLADLDLSGNEISDEGVRLLVQSRLWPRLRRLVLGGNPLSDVAAEALADAAGTSQLEYLNLKFTGLTSAGHRVLLRKFPRRTKLDLF